MAFFFVGRFLVAVPSVLNFVHIEHFMKFPEIEFLILVLEMVCAKALNCIFLMYLNVLQCIGMLSMFSMLSHNSQAKNMIFTR